MRTVEAFREVEDADPWLPYIVELSNGEQVIVDRQGLVTWDEPDPADYVRFKSGDGALVLIALDAVVAVTVRTSRGW